MNYTRIDADLESTQRQWGAPCTSTRSAAAAALVGLAIMIVGALALSGVQNPHGSLAHLGEAIGSKGGIAMIVTGGLTFIFFSVIHHHCAKREVSKYVSIEESHEQL